MDYKTFREIPQFPFASYRVNMGWGYLEDWMRQQNEYYVVELNPAYQRGYVWSEEQKERYIEYQLKGGFSGKDIFWNSPSWMRGVTKKGEVIELVDGKQRVDAVIGFMNNKVKAFGKFKNEFEDKLPPIKYDLIFHINNLQTQKEVVEWYLGLNRGGSIHTETDLKPAYDLLKTF